MCEGIHDRRQPGRFPSLNSLNNRPIEADHGIAAYADSKENENTGE